MLEWHPRLSGGLWNSPAQGASCQLNTWVLVALTTRHSARDLAPNSTLLGPEPVRRRSDEATNTQVSSWCQLGGAASRWGRSGKGLSVHQVEPAATLAPLSLAGGRGER